MHEVQAKRVQIPSAFVVKLNEETCRSVIEAGIISDPLPLIDLTMILPSTLKFEKAKTFSVPGPLEVSMRS